MRCSTRIRPRNPSVWSSQALGLPRPPTVRSPPTARRSPTRRTKTTTARTRLTTIAPAAKPDTATIDEDTATDYIDVMANDTDVDLDAALNQDNLLLRSNFSISATWLDNDAYGTVSVVDNKIKL